MKNFFLSAVSAALVLYLSAGILSAADSEYTDPKEQISVKAEYIEAEDVYQVTITAKTTGWVAVCFDPKRVMKDGEFLIGYVEGDKVFVEDHWGTSLIRHKKKTDQSVLVHFSGTEKDKVTTLIIKRKASVSGEYLKELKHGQTVKMLWAMCDSDSIKKIHNSNGHFELTLP